MATKQATHLQPSDGMQIRIIVCDLGGFIVSTGRNEAGYHGTEAGFTTADECAEWVRGFLRNSAARMFGPTKEKL